MDFSVLVNSVPLKIKILWIINIQRRGIHALHSAAAAPCELFDFELLNLQEALWCPLSSSENEILILIFKYRTTFYS